MLYRLPQASSPELDYDIKALVSKSKSPTRLQSRLYLLTLEFITTNMSGSSPSSRAVVSPSLLVSIAATPWLSAIVSIRAASSVLEQLGLASEEMFRGDRLPVLHFPDADGERLDSSVSNPAVSDLY